MKLAKIIFCIIITSLVSYAEEEQELRPKPPTNLFAGFGPALSVTGGILGFAQVGGDFFITGNDRLNFLLGPQANIYFAHQDFNFGFIGINFKLSHQKIFSNNTRIDLYARLPVQIGFGKSHGSKALGFNIGLLPGFAYFFNNTLGIYTELGAQGMFHLLFPEGPPAGYLLLSLNLGLTFNL